MDIGFVPMTEYWFARRFPVGNPRQSMAPVHWKGYAIVAIYVTLLVLGGIAFAWFGAGGQFALGVALFVAAAIVGGGLFIFLSYAKGDKTRTVAEYRKDAGRV